jgi:Mg2+/Co2+ transporter CorB
MDTTGSSLEIIGFIALLAGSAFFAGAETALTGASRARMVALEEAGDARAGLVLKLRDQREKLIGTLLLGNTFMNIFASALATMVLVPVFGEKGLAIATAGVTVTVFVFAEMMPKTYALMHADRSALLLAYPLRAVVALFSPLTLAAERGVGGLFRLLRLEARSASETAHEEELRGAIELFKDKEEAQAQPEGQEQGAMLRSIMDLADVKVEEIMIHRKNVNMINVGMPVAQIVDEVLHSAYTRIPAWKDSPDNIVGVIHTKLLLQELSHCNGDVRRVDVANAMMEPWFIPESTTLLDQLQAFRRRREHLAMMVDEYGALIGMITMEDILEEIVGQIDDEHDAAVPGVRPQADGAFIVDGKVTIRDLKRDLDWELPDEEYSTLAGLLLFESQRIPAVGQIFHFHEFRFEILKKQRNQITLVRVTPPAAKPPGAVPADGAKAAAGGQA